MLYNVEFALRSLLELIHAQGLDHHLLAKETTLNRPSQVTSCHSTLAPDDDPACLFWRRASRYLAWFHPRLQQSYSPRTRLSSL